MKPELRDYVVSVLCGYDDDNNYHYIHFVTEYPVNSVGFWEDFYDTVFDLVDYSVDDFNFRIVEIEEGF